MNHPSHPGYHASPGSQLAALDTIGEVRKAALSDSTFSAETTEEMAQHATCLVLLADATYIPDTAYR